jgi:hypothetical protein
MFIFSSGYSQCISVRNLPVQSFEGTKVSGIKGYYTAGHLVKNEVVEDFLCFRASLDELGRYTKIIRKEFDDRCNMYNYSQLYTYHDLMGIQTKMSADSVEVNKTIYYYNPSGEVDSVFRFDNHVLLSKTYNKYSNHLLVFTCTVDATNDTLVYNRIQMANSKPMNEIHYRKYSGSPASYFNHTHEWLGDSLITKVEHIMGDSLFNTRYIYKAYHDDQVLREYYTMEGAYEPFVNPIYDKVEYKYNSKGLITDMIFSRNDGNFDSFYMDYRFRFEYEYFR